MVFAAIASGCFVDALGVATDGGEGAATPSTSTSATMNGDGGATSATSSTGGLGGAGGAGGFGPVLVSECTGDEVAVDIVDGMLVCEALTEKINTAIDGGCFIQLAWRDQCDFNCPDPGTLAKWGRTTLTDCQHTGGDGDCRPHTLGGVAVETYGLNFDGSVNQDDRMYAGFICEAGDDAEANCNGDDVLVTGVNGKDAICSVATRAIYAPLRDCSFVFGWKDNCDGSCGEPPQKIGSASANACTPDASGVCVDSPYDAPLDLVSFDLDGGANDDDRFFFGLSCGTATPATTTAVGSCPMGQFVNGIYEDGSLRCRSIQDISLAHFTQSCWLYAGWLDLCGACDDPPSQWGRVRAGGCEPGVVDDDACATVMFNGQKVSMFGLSPDGIVDYDDKVFVGLSCE